MSLGKYFKTVGDLFTYFNINVSQEDIAPGLMELDKYLFPKSSEDMESKVFAFSSYINNTCVVYTTDIKDAIKNANDLFLGDNLSLDTVTPFLKEKGIFDEMLNFCINRYNRGIEPSDPEYVTIDYFKEYKNRDILYSLIGCGVLIFSTGSGILLYNPTYYKNKFQK
jgi:hypothetical protein|nr:MAG TPA: hypothetical protein [Caudoviricetes sp.]